MTNAQGSRRGELYALLGELPDRNRPVSATSIDHVEFEEFALDRLVLDLNGVEPVPAIFTRPREIPPPWPVVLYNHAHGGDYVLGKKELIDGRAALQDPPYAKALAARGIAALAIDHWGFGERRGRTESEIFKAMLWNGRVLWGHMVYDSLRALDYLAGRDEVNVERIGTLGLSMGSTMAWWAAALDVRVRVCVDICCLTDFAALLESRDLDRHGLYYYVPDLLSHFSTADINALIAPRAHLSLAGNFDRLTPPRGLDRIDAALREAYAEARQPEHWRLVRSDTGHFETAAFRHEILQFLDEHL